MNNTITTWKWLLSQTHRRLRQIAICGSLITALPAQTSNAAVSFDWVKQTKANIDGGRAMAIDNSGNIYTIGIFGGTVDFDPGPAVYNMTAAGSLDVFITKIDAAGNFVWAKTIGGSDLESPRTVALDAAGNPYICGSFSSSSIDADPGSGTHTLTLTGKQDGFVVKLDAAGNFAWARQFAGTGADVTVHAMDIDPSGNIYIGGVFSGTSDFDPGSGTLHFSTAAVTQYDAFLTKLDASGNFTWARQLESDEYAGIASINADASGNLYAFGCFQNTIDCDPGSGLHQFTTRGLMDLFVVKLDGSGTFTWGAHAGGTEPDWPRGMDIDASGNVYITGTFDGNADFDPEGSGYVLHSVGSFPNPDVFVLKLSNTGAFSWVRQFGSSSPDAGGGITLDPDGNIYTTGSFVTLMDADPGSAGVYLSGIAEDAFISKLDAAGNYVWAGSMPAANEFGFSRTTSIALDPDNNIYTTGTVNDTVDADPGPGVYLMRSANGGSFIHKLINTSTSIPGMAVDNMTIAPNPVIASVDINTVQNLTNGSLRLIDMSGRTVINYRGLSGQHQKIRLDGLAPGSYQLELSDAGQVYRATISKK